MKTEGTHYEARLRRRMGSAERHPALVGRNGKSLSNGFRTGNLTFLSIDDVSEGANKKAELLFMGR